MIRDARVRRRRRWAGFFSTIFLALLIAGAAWRLLDGSSHGAPRPGVRAIAALWREPLPPGFDIRLVPTLTVGSSGWCEVPVEPGRAGGSACGPLPVIPDPMPWGFGWSDGKRSVEIVITTSETQSVLVGGRRVATVSLPGLPYGLRAVRLANPGRGGRLAALDAHGDPIREPGPAKPVHQIDARNWRAPAAPPRGVCSLRSLPGAPRGLETLGGTVSLAVRPFRGQIVGHGFLPCAETRYRIKGVPLAAVVLVDAADPATYAADLPDFHPILHGDRLFAEGGLLARRDGRGWIVAKQGADVKQRIALLERLTAVTP